MSLERPSKSERPNEEAIQEVVENQLMSRKVSPMGFESTKNEFISWSEGEIDSTRKEFYPGWRDEDFKTVLDKLGGE